MRHTFRKRGLVAVASVLLLTASACGQGGDGGGSGGSGEADRSAGSSGSAPEGEPTSGGTATFAYAVDAASVDSANCGSSVSWMACTAIYGTLVTFDAETLEYGPGMAESFESEDGKVWTITLRPDLTFSDGTPFDAEAVAFNWDRAKDPVNRNSSAPQVAAMQWDVKDARTLEVTLPEVDYQFPSLLYTTIGVIGSPTAIREKGPDFANAPVGAGPFTFVSWSRGTEMKLARNDSYYDAPRPYLDELVIKTIPQEQQRYNALKSGDIDIDATSSNDIVQQALGEGSSETHLTNLTGAGMRFSTKNGDVVDREVRETIGHALDTDAILEAVYSNDPAPRTFALQGGKLFDEQAKLPEYDLAKAQEVFDAYREKTGKREVTVKYLTPAGVSQTVQESQMIKAQLEQVEGLKVELEEAEIIAWTMRIRQGDYEATLHTMGATFDPAMLYDRIHTKGGENGAGYSNPEVDAALDASRATADPGEQIEHIKEAIRAYTADVAAIPWTQTVQYWFHNGDIGGLKAGYTYYPRPDLLWKG